MFVGLGFMPFVFIVEYNWLSYVFGGRGGGVRRCKTNRRTQKTGFNLEEKYSMGLINAPLSNPHPHKFRWSLPYEEWWKVNVL